MNSKQDILTDLYKSTCAVFLLSILASTIGNAIDGMIIGIFLGSEAIAAFGFTLPYQRLVLIFPGTLALGMQIICTKNSAGANLTSRTVFFRSP